MATQRVIHTDYLDSSDVREFMKVARRLCDVVDGIAHLSEVEFLRQIGELAPLAYAKGVRLEWPDHYEGQDDDDDGLGPRPEVPIPYGGHLKWWKHLRDAIGLKLGWHRVFHFVYNPAHPNDRKVIGADLADCISDIYMDLKKGLLHYDQGTLEHKAEAVWQWKFGITGWGTHVAEILLPIHHLLHTHYDEDEDCWRPFYEVTP